MRTWHTSDNTIRCGYCGGSIPSGEPYLCLVNENGVSFHRCPAHAGEPVPAQLEPVQDKAPSTFTKLSAIHEPQ